MSGQVPDAGRIPKVAAEATVITLYILALTAVSLRTAIRTHYRKLQWLDDGFLVLAVVLLTIGVALFFAMLNDLYIAEALIYDTFAVLSVIDVNSIQDIAIRVQTYTLVYNIICITGIFAVKFSFLFFFNNILSRIRCITLYWRCVVGYVTLAWAFSIGFSAYACPYTDERAESCAQGAELGKAIDTSIVLIFCDVSTDLLIISIPVLVLKQIRLQMRKKLFLAGSLCLSVVMVVVAILQAATLTYMGVPAIDVVWEIYFQLVELTLAIMVVSITAFRAFFVQRGSRNQDSPRTPSSWTSSRRYRGALKKIWPSTSTESRDRQAHPPMFPLASPEISGVRTEISHGDGDIPIGLALEPPVESDSNGFHTNAWSPHFPMRPRFESLDAGSRVDASQDYHHIQRLMVHVPSQHDSGIAGEGMLASPSTQAMAATAAPDLEARVIEPEVGISPSTRGVTPVSSSLSAREARTNSDGATPSPISPDFQRRSPPVHLQPPPGSTQRRRPLVSHNEALSPGPVPGSRSPAYQPASPPPPPPAAHPQEHHISEEARQPASAVPRRISHIAAQALPSVRLSTARGSTDSGDQAVAASAGANAAARRSVRRSNVEPEMRESGVKRLISASMARAWDFKAQRAEGEED